MSKFENAVEIFDLTKSFGKVKAVDSLSLSVKRGEIYGFLGPNGAGKTTTLKMLAGLTKPDSGHILLSGNEATFGNNKARMSLGYLPDVPECYGYMNSSEFLTLSASLYGLDTKDIKVRVNELMNLVGLEGVKKRIGSFSRGMKQRLGIAQALINTPDIVLMDEPVSALDPEGRHEIIEILYNIKGSATVFFSTHIISDIERICDSIAIIGKGKLLEHGNVKDIKLKYDNHIVSVILSPDCSTVSAENFIKTISSMGWCSSVESLSPLNYKIKVSDRGNAQIAIPRILADYSIPLQIMDSVSVSLEEIFLEVIKQ